MSEYIAPLEQLIERFRTFKGIGRKTAVRLAFNILDFTEEQTTAFANAVIEAKRSIKECPVCFNICDSDLCKICSDPDRDRSKICVVEDAKTIMSFERVREYRGMYHVLKGTISPIDGRGPEQLKIAELIKRIGEGGVDEIIIATNPTIDGETTALYLSKILKPYDLKITRIAYGIPVGGDLEYADEVTLLKAFEGRRDI